MKTHTFLIAAFLFTGCGPKMTSDGEAETEDTGTPSLPSPTDDPGGSDDTGDTDLPPDLTDDSGDTPTPPTGISERHPRIFFSPSDFPRLQARVYEPSRVEVVTAWDNFAAAYRDPTSVPLGEGALAPSTDDEWQALTAPLPNLALFTTFTSDEEMKVQVVEWMIRVAALETWGVGEIPPISVGALKTLQNFCLVFDWLHDELPPSLRNSFRSRIIVQGSQLNNILGGPLAPWSDQWSGHEAQQANLSLLMAGLTLEHVHDPALEWIARTTEFAENTVEGLSKISDGSWPEGPGLGSEALDSMYKTFFLVDRHFGLDFQDLLWIQARSEATVRTALPDQMSQMATGDGTGDWYLNPIVQACFIDQFSSTHLATWQADQYILAAPDSAHGASIWLEMLWCDPDIEATAPGGSMTPSHHFEDWGTVTWHNGFSSGNSSIIIRAGLPVSATVWDDVVSGSGDGSDLDMRRLHPDAGSFGWYPNGTSVITTGRNQTPKRTQLENTYTFGTDTPINRGWTEVDREAWWPSGSFYSDIGDLSQVGQLGEWDTVYGPIETLREASAGFEYRDTKARITVVGSEFSGMYPSGFNTDLGWQPLGLERLARYWVILENGIVLIFDNLRHSTALTHYNRFHSDYSGFSVGGIAATVSSSDGSSWVIEAGSGGSLASDQLIGDVTAPSPGWVNQLVVTNYAGPGSHHHLTILRSTSQSVVMTGWEPTEEGVTANLVVTDIDGVTTYAIRFASSEIPSERQAYLGFPGRMGITRNVDAEIQF